MMNSGGGNFSKQSKLLKKLQQIKNQKSTPTNEEPSSGVKSLADAPSNLTANADWRSRSKGIDDDFSTELDDTRLKKVRTSSGLEVNEYKIFDDLLERSSEIFSRSGDMSSPFESIPDEKTLFSSKRNMFQPGDFAPLEIWGKSLKDSEGNSTPYNSVKGSRPLVVIADARPVDYDMKETLINLNTNFPKSAADLVVITPNTPPFNRKLKKKSNLFFPILSDIDREWLHTYLVTSTTPWEKMMFIIEPKYGKFTAVIPRIESATVIEQLLDALKASD